MKPDTNADRDAAQLEALGYDSKFERKMSLWANFSLGFTYLSPVVGVYTLFATVFPIGGPAMFWSYLLVGLGQLLWLWYSARLFRSSRLLEAYIPGRVVWWESVGRGSPAGCICGRCAAPSPGLRSEERLI